MIKHVLVTGASGFIGRVLCDALAAAGHTVRVASRGLGEPAQDEANRNVASSPSAVQSRVAVGTIGPDTDWSSALEGVDAVVHLAGQTHVPPNASAEVLAELRSVNVAGTERLARMAATAGVKRLVFVSSIKVSGEQSVGAPFAETDQPNPHDAYAVSKWEAENLLRQIAADTGLEVVIVRPPLVYGPGVGGNFVRLMEAVARGIPLPLGCVRNARSLVYVGNLANALVVCLAHEAAAGQTFLVSDGTDLSTPELVRKLAHAMNRPARLLPIPAFLIRLAAAMAGRPDAARRLLGSLAVSSGKIREKLGWVPPYTLAQGLEETAAWFKASGAGVGGSLQTVPADSRHSPGTPE